jgi:hypothetical protein
MTRVQILQQWGVSLVDRRGIAMNRKIGVFIQYQKVLPTCSLEVLNDKELELHILGDI